MTTYRNKEDQMADYREARAEARAWGDYDFPSFEVWSGEEDPRLAAELRVRAEMENGENYDLY